MDACGGKCDMGRMTYLGYDWIGYLLPVKAVNQLIHIPFPKYLFQEVQDYVSLPELGAVIGFMLLIYWGTIKLVEKEIYNTYVQSAKSLSESSEGLFYVKE